MIKPEKPEVQIVLITTFMITSQPDGFRAGQSQKIYLAHGRLYLLEKASKWPKENIKP